jgi:hypothetical protein
MFVPSVQAGYTIFTRDQITPASITVYGVDGPETRNNPGTPPVYPGTFQRRICAARDLYSPLAADRAEVWVDSAGNIPTDDAALFAACPQIRDTKRAEIRAEGDRRLGALATPYMLHERETWATQKEEATAWTANNAAPIPMVSNMAAARGITVAELMAKIMENVNLFTTSSGAILGEQQFLLDWIDREQSFDTLLTIGWPQ